MGAVTPTKRFAIIAIILLGLIALIAAVTFMSTRPKEADYNTAADSFVPKITDAQSKLPAAANSYFKAFTNAQVAEGSAEKASKATTDELSKYKQAESAARKALEKLTGSRAANDSETGIAIEQYAEASNDYIDYLSTLVGSYGHYRSLFDGSDSKICSDIFLKNTASFAERRDNLSKAAKDCHAALGKMKNSGNASYIDYAIKMDRRLTQLEEYSVRTAQGEKEYHEFTVKAKTAQQKLATLDAKGSTAKEYDALTAEIKKLDEEIAQSESSFEGAASRYISTVEGLPTLYGAVFDKSVPAKMKSLESLIRIRSQVLEITLDDKRIN